MNLAGPTGLERGNSERSEREWERAAKRLIPHPSEPRGPGSLLGHLGHDPAMRYTPEGTPVVNARLATTRRWKDLDSGDQREHTEWHRVVVFGNGAKFLGEYARKGAQVYVEGSLRTRDWTDRDGVKRFTTEVVARDVQLLGKKTDVAAPPAADEPPAQDEPEESDDIPF